MTVDLTLDECEGHRRSPGPGRRGGRGAAGGRPQARGLPDRTISPPCSTRSWRRTLTEARDRIQELEKREAEHLDKHHRLLADFSNYRNRTNRDIQMAVDLSERKLLLEILPVLDNFERCIGSSYQTVEDFRNGVALIQKQFMDALRRLGVEPVVVNVGDPFDALHAEALSTTSDANLADGAVAAVYERGFLLREQLLRAARVVVNHAPGEHQAQ